MWCFFFQAEDGIRDLVRSRGLGDVYKRQTWMGADGVVVVNLFTQEGVEGHHGGKPGRASLTHCLLYTSAAADERSRVDLGGRRIIKKKSTGTFGVSV
mgnify:CR=1 FL=1